MPKGLPFLFEVGEIVFIKLVRTLASLVLDSSSSEMSVHVVGSSKALCEISPSTGPSTYTANTASSSIRIISRVFAEENIARIWPLIVSNCTSLA